MSKFKEGMFGPTVVLFAICFAATFALAFTHNITAPIIEAARLSAVQELSIKGMPDPDTFIEYDAADFPRGIEEVFITEDGSYFVFRAVTRGFGGRINFFIAMDSDGNYTGIVMGENTETPGFGNLVAAPAYLENYVGLSDPDLVDAVTGATVTSNALKAALALCNQAFLAAKEGQ